MAEFAGPRFLGPLAGMSVDQFMIVVRTKAAEYRTHLALGAEDDITVNLPPLIMVRSTFELLAAALAEEHIRLSPDTVVVEDG